MSHTLGPDTGIPHQIEQYVDMHLLDLSADGHRIRTRLSYDASAPLEVRAAFETGASQVTWTFGRDLLLSGVYSPTGEGDVRVWPSLSGSGSATVVL